MTDSLQDLLDDFPIGDIRNDELPLSIPTVDVEVEIPGEDNFRPRLFNGPKDRARLFHNVPRGGNTNDIVSLTSEDNEDAREYVRGVIVVALVMALIYVVWAILLFCVRAGRIGECKLCGGCKSMTQCVESFRAQGGCCSRAVCGWMSGRPPKRPTKASLKRDQLYKENGITENISAAITHSTSAAINAAKTVVVASSSVIKKKEVDHDADSVQGRLDLVEGLNTSEEPPPPANNDENDKGDGNEQHDKEEPNNENIANDILPSGDAGDSEGKCNSKKIDDDTISISEEYLSKRVREAERTMKWIRILFLFAGAVVLAACIALSVSGFHAINSILSTSQDTLVVFEQYFGSIVDECDAYIAKADELTAGREAFLYGFENSTDDTSICPNAHESDGDGLLNVDINLGQLFDGPLLKLGEVKDPVTGNVTIEVISFLDDTIFGTAVRVDLERLKRLVKDSIPDDIPEVSLPASGNISLPDDGLPGNFSGARNFTSIVIEGGNRMMQGEEQLPVATISVIGNATAYKNRDLSDLLETNFSIAVNFTEIVGQINKKLESRPEFLTDLVYSLRSIAKQQYDGIRSLDETLNGVLPYWYVAVAFASFLMIVVAFMMIGTVLAWINKQPRIFRHANDAIILPIFIVAGLLTWIFTCVFLCLGILSGDLCINTPDTQVNGILENVLQDTPTIVYNFVNYYLNGCQPDDRPILVDLLALAIAETRRTTTDFFNLVSGLGAGPLGKACGSDLSLLRTVAYVLSERLNVSLDVVQSIGKAVLCSSFHPLYSDVMYDIMCTDVINMVGPMFASLFFISIFSMIMVTLRVAWHELEDDICDEKDEEAGCCRYCLGSKGPASIEDEDSNRLGVEDEDSGRRHRRT